MVQLIISFRNSCLINQKNQIIFLQIEALCQLIERQWYEDRNTVEAALSRATGHDLAAVFKRLLRALPQPPLTQELMRLFYHTYGKLLYNKLLSAVSRI